MAETKSKGQLLPGRNERSSGANKGHLVQPGKDQSVGLEKTLEDKKKNAGLPAVERVDEFKDFMERHRKDFEMVIPKQMNPERLLRLSISACRRSPKLMACWPATIFGGLMEASALGLEVNSPLHHASLIPFKNNRTRRDEAQLIIEYEGYIHLMLNHPKVLSVFANVVFEKDHLEYHYGSNAELNHVEYEKEDQGDIRGFYAYATLAEGAFVFKYLPKHKVDAIRDMYSESYKRDQSMRSTPGFQPQSAWNTSYIAMGCKTAIRAIQKYVPKSAETNQALNADFKVIDALDKDNFSPVSDAGQ